MRIALARNPHTPSAVLERLAHDRHHTVQWYAVLNPQMPETGLRQLAAQENEQSGGRTHILREVIAHHPNATEALRAEMTGSGTCRVAIDCATMATALRRAANT
ncbi:hypothetical protein [Actinomadura algeriensis]|uniref:Uncharacterized protein n=1 Tax=Actinomadura algeriensis TaxID=1679523 RepID=A0ABR9JTQ4_9ACTN|nr:hypothetical protein [Actinomadura algeriensis]MBE1533490.1 hypothetical protein [Actinomadura algeriensis]